MAPQVSDAIDGGFSTVSSAGEDWSLLYCLTYFYVVFVNNYTGVLYQNKQNKLGGYYQQRTFCSHLKFQGQMALM